jgi:hypothetical protein
MSVLHLAVDALAPAILAALIVEYVNRLLRRAKSDGRTGKAWPPNTSVSLEMRFSLAVRRFQTVDGRPTEDESSR